MSVTDHDRQTVESVFRAMQQGPSGEALMVSLFAEDAEFTESFTGQPQTHRGTDEIRAAFLASVQHSPPDLALQLDRLDKEGEELKATWTCTSSAFPTPMRGYDMFRIRDQKIVKLEIVTTEMPDFGGGHP